MAVTADTLPNTDAAAASGVVVGRRSSRVSFLARRAIPLVGSIGLASSAREDPERSRRGRRRRSGERPLTTLRTKLATVFLLAALPAAAVWMAGALNGFHGFARERDRALSDDVVALAHGIDRAIGTPLTASAAAFEALEMPQRPLTDDSRRRGGAVLLGLGARAIHWRPSDNGLAAEEFDGPINAEHEALLARQAVATKGTVTGTAHTAAATMPVFFVPTSRAGALEILPDLARVPEVVAPASPRKSASVIVFDADHHVLGHSPGLTEADARTIIAWIAPEIVAASRAKVPSADGLRVVKGTPAAHAPPIVAAFARSRLAPMLSVALVEPASAATSQWGMIVAELTGAAVLAVVLFLIAATWTGGRLTRPIVALAANARAVARGDETNLDRVPRSSIVEFEELRENLARADAVMRRRSAAERMALQEARTGHELLASVVNGTADMIYVKDGDLRIVLANPIMLAAGDEAREEWEVLGRAAGDLLPADLASAEEQHDRAVLSCGGTRHMRLEWPGRNGAVRTYALTKTPWRNASGHVSGVVTVGRDITDQRAAESRLATVQAELLRATRLSSMGAMASGLAHELNQPLAAATNFLNAAARLLARLKCCPGDPMLDMTRAAVSDAAGQTLRAGQIVRRLRDFVGRGEAALQPEDVGDLIREACDIARSDGALAGVVLSLRVSDRAGVALVERTQLQQVLLNLIRNAAEALSSVPSGRSEPSEPPTIVVSVEDRSDEGVAIRVADNGPGLAPAIVERLFQPFVSTKTYGMGIGLAICRTIVEGHGGQLSAAPNPSGGVVFTIALPPVMRALND